MSKTVQIAAIQCSLDGSLDQNLAVLSELISGAAMEGANIILTPELIEGPYFCKTQTEAPFARAYAIDEHPAVQRFADLARAHEVVLPVSVFEKEGPHYFNTVAVLDADGSILGTYRKSHIPDGPGYQEKFYFRPGDTGFRVWPTRFGRVGVGICWDQWFPEVARAMALLGADFLFYPTAIGSEPHDASLDTRDRWRRVMQGHAVANVIPVAASNRIGSEDGQVFYGSSFIADQTGSIIDELGRDETGFVSARFDLAKIETERASWGFFRDRRTDLYNQLG